MRIFINPYEMIREVERDLFEMGIQVQPESMQDLDVKDNPDYETLELQAYGYTLTNATKEKLTEAMDYMKCNTEWAMSEFADRVDDRHINPGNSWELRKEVWVPYIHDGRFAYTYNERFREQLPYILWELSKRPNTRQAVMTMYDRHQDITNMGGKSRIPCSMYYQFYIRNGQLNLIYTMRSVDFLTHFMYDVYFAVRLLEFVASVIKVPIGHFTHFMGSLHAYKKDMQKRGIF